MELDTTRKDAFCTLFVPFFNLDLKIEMFSFRLKKQNWFIILYIPKLVGIIHERQIYTMNMVHNLHLSLSGNGKNPNNFDSSFYDDWKWNDLSNEMWIIIKSNTLFDLCLEIEDHTVRFVLVLLTFQGF